MQDFINFLQKGALVPQVSFLTFPFSFIFCPLDAMVLNILAWELYYSTLYLNQQYLLHKLNIHLENKKPTRCHLLFYCTSYRLNMFQALLCPSSGARDYDVYYHIGRFGLGLLYVGG